MLFGAAVWLVLAGAGAGVGAERWRWPEAAESVRIDTKVSFLQQDQATRTERKSVLEDEVPFKAAEEAEGFYNRGGVAGRFPVRVQSHQQNYRVDPHGVYSVEHYPHNNRDNYIKQGIADSFQYCKCTTNHDCTPRRDIPNSCSTGKVLCCFKKPNPNNVNSEIFNELNDERAELFPNRERYAGPFSQPAPVQHNQRRGPQHPAVLTGPNGPTGHIGPDRDLVRHENVQHPGVLAGPGGPTGIIGPTNNQNEFHGPPRVVESGKTGNRGVLVGPNGPTGHIGPHRDLVRHENVQRPGVLAGPGGPTGIIGPIDNHDAIHGPPRDVGSSQSAQRGVLVGPGGPTGVIGPGGYRQQAVLVGPGGPTGILGPNIYRGGRLVGQRNPSFGRSPGLLVGPGGPTGIIGPGRQLLVGPEGPTGYIGPRRSYDA